MYRYLKQLDAPIENLSYILPDIMPDDGIFVVDTTELFGALQGDISEKTKLERMCLLLKTSTVNTHNAGNDAYVRNFTKDSQAVDAIFIELFIVHTACSEVYGIWEPARRAA